ADLTERKEQLEREMARKSAAFRQGQALNQLTPQQLQAALPAEAALLDFLEYTHGTPPADKKGAGKFERRLTAFVVRPGRPLGQVPLGTVPPIAAALDRWHAAVLRKDPVTDPKGPGDELRRRLWQPLEKALRGAHTVLIAPDGVLTRLPFAALPGS